MRKKLIFTIAALLMGATMFAQEQTQVQVQNQRQEKQIMKRNRVNVQNQEQPKEMVRQRKMNQEAVKSGDPIMQRDQKRIQKKDGTGDGTGNAIQQRDRDRVNFQKQARPMNRMTRPPMQGAQKRGGR
jgi:hypothetical protein